MDFLTGKIKPMYFKYLAAAFGSALISSIYGVVDMAMVGQYQGPQGTAALAIVSPVWNIIYSLGLLMGIGGSVIFSTLRGESEQNQKKSNEYFTAAVIGVVILAVITWLSVIFFDRELLRLFGAEETLLPLARRYLFPVKFVVPSFLFTQLMAAFLRNDGNPALATKAVLFGGIFNVFGDYFFVFVLNMGIMGAGLATAMGILTMLFNRQILKYLGTDALSVYGIIINISTFVQCCAYSIGQASQPMISTNYGAGKVARIAQILKYALGTAAVFGFIWTALAILAPNMFVRIFMTPTEEILAIAPGIIRSYGSSFLLLPFNIFSTYYFQALMRPKTSFVVSVSRGAVISGILICILPAVIGANAIWFAMPVTELLVAIYVIMRMMQYTKAMCCI